LKDNSINIADVDLVITGKNGDTTNDKIYKSLEQSLFKDTAIANYKHLCGEYPTSSSFGLWVAANVIKTGEVPAVIAQNKVNNKAPKKVLLYNHYQSKYHSLMLVSSI
jgi:hypothetical protein